MSDRKIFCHKLKQTLPGLSTPPYPTPLGERIYNEISQEAWGMWLSHQTMLINEYRLSLVDPSAREFLLDAMEKFLFNNESTPPAGFTENKSD